VAKRTPVPPLTRLVDNTQGRALCAGGAGAAIAQVFGPLLLQRLATPQPSANEVTKPCTQ